MRRYTISGIICSADNQPKWSGQVEVEAKNAKGAAEAGKQLIAATVPHESTDTIQVLRTQQHSDTFKNGEVEEMVEFGADFSPDRLYRYGLYRIWNKAKLPLMVIGLNPSTADEKLNDPTVRRCIRFAKDLGYGGLLMTNAFAFRATSPQALKTIQDPTGPENDAWLVKLSQKAGIVVAAWGNHGGINGRGAQIRKLLPQLHYFSFVDKNGKRQGLTDSGEPRHPLYLPADAQPVKLN